MKSYLTPEYIVERDQDRCIRCKVCVNQCTYETHNYDPEDDIVRSTDANCTNCQRCVVFCPTNAIAIRRNPNAYRENANWSQEAILGLKKQAEAGGMILTGMGCDKPHFTYWDRLLLNASQVTNPSIDPLREPMEIRTYLGGKPDKLELEMKDGDVVLRLANGTASVTPAYSLFPDHPPTSVETDIVTFSQIFAGFISAEQPRTVGRLRAKDATCARLTAAFAAAPLFMHRSDWF